jgi:hypothetical protein
LKTTSGPSPALMKSFLWRAPRAGERPLRLADPSAQHVSAYLTHFLVTLSNEQFPEQSLKQALTPSG